MEFFFISVPKFIGNGVIQDYKDNDLHEEAENLEKNKHTHFSKFHDLDLMTRLCNGETLEISGLILGYPIENTISILKRKRKYT